MQCMTYQFYPEILVWTLNYQLVICISSENKYSDGRTTLNTFVHFVLFLQIKISLVLI
jgi:hypothetical protein